ncbi:LysR family transcriptional regulator [Pusillimonas sp. DMV24BSW_D]|uniref:LysR family transcriptional regulator n=1 Tax=Neopusillimonas aestuarii TaxID=2716226 RepID=UPI00140764C7|nr:LysR family transcriptional regulator [Pusillimonas sp. DMV24BSW_D]QIM48607.1 LysR family transcriptional regulator [Pusillimonas sp. DMV24BSW_D]
MDYLKTTLEQWRALAAVVEHGGFAQAAQALHRSQSSISYLVGKLQSQIDLPLLEVEGRKAQLTDAGHTLLTHAQELLSDAYELEELARRMGAGWEAELRLVVDVAFPKAVLVQALKRFSQEAPFTRLKLSEVVLSGAEEALLDQEADMMIGAYIPHGHLGQVLLNVPFIAVACRDHPLIQLGRPVGEDDLKRHMHIVVRDSGTQNPRNEGWLGSTQRWTVSSLEASVSLVAGGLGFAWLPQHLVEPYLTQGMLVPIPVELGQIRQTPLYLVFGTGAQTGPAASCLAGILQELGQQER